MYPKIGHVSLHKSLIFAVSQDIAAKEGVQSCYLKNWEVVSHV